MKRKIILFILLIFALNKITYSQIIAGSGDSLQVISYPNINLSAAVSFQSVNATIDLNCDSIADMKFTVHKGASAIDAPNSAYLTVLNPDFQICADTAAFGVRKVTYFSFGDTLNNPDTCLWYNDTLYFLGDYGSFEAFGPFSITNKFIAFNNTATNQKGWIKISFDLIDNGSFTDPVTLSIPEILSPCINTLLSIDQGGEPLSGSESCGVFYYDYTISPETCPGSCDGSIEISNLSGGTPGYTYLWDDPATQASSTAQGLCSGTYNVVFTDAMGNTCTADFTMVSGPTLSYNLVVTNVSCFGGVDGSICVDSLSGGSAPFMFLWSPSGSTSQCINSVPAGSYSICVYDVNGCQTCTTAVVQEPAPVEITFNTTNISCFGECDGSICSSAIGGVGIYSFQWDASAGSATTACINSLCAGNYELCVTDANGCQACATAVITEPTPLILSDTVFDASCFTCCDGDLQLTINGGTIPYVINYVPGPNPSAGNFCPGEYYFCVTDGNGCELCDSATVSFATAIEEINGNDEINILPNPADQYIVIESNQNIANTTCEIIDINGKLVMTVTLTSGKERVNIGKLRSGKYFLRYKLGNKMKIKSFVVL